MDTAPSATQQRDGDTIHGVLLGISGAAIVDEFEAGALRSGHGIQHPAGARARHRSFAAAVTTLGGQTARPAFDRKAVEISSEVRARQRLTLLVSHRHAYPSWA
jgi:hypothetical protein